MSKIMDIDIYGEALNVCLCGNKFLVNGPGSAGDLFAKKEAAEKYARWVVEHIATDMQKHYALIKGAVFDELNEY